MSAWMSSESWRDVLSLSATISTVLQFLTGSLICREYFKLKSVGDVSSFNLVFKIVFHPSLLNCRHLRYHLQLGCSLALYGFVMVFLLMIQLWLLSMQLECCCLHHTAYHFSCSPWRNGKFCSNWSWCCLWSHLLSVTVMLNILKLMHQGS